MGRSAGAAALGLGLLIDVRPIGRRFMQARIRDWAAAAVCSRGAAGSCCGEGACAAGWGRISGRTAADCGCGAETPWEWGTEAGTEAPGWRRVGFLCCRGLLRGLFEPWEAG